MASPQKPGRSNYELGVQPAFIIQQVSCLAEILRGLGLCSSLGYGIRQHCGLVDQLAALACELDRHRCAILGRHRHRTLQREVITQNPSENSTRMLLSLPRAVIRQGWPNRSGSRV